MSLAELARIIGVQRNTLLSMVRRGCPYIARANRAKGIEWQLNTAEVAQWRIDEAVKEAIGDVRETDINELRKRKLRAETIIAELDAAKARGQVGDLDEFERQVTAASIEIRTRLKQMISRVAPMVIGVKKITAIKAILADEVDQALTTLADKLGSNRK
ncbi:MAG: terminase small subunit [Proteobacteria bacterium]|nr:terminase small subunit [Pseudomonadota bacterium]